MLPPYPEASKALAVLIISGWRCFGLSNGEPGDLAVLPDNAGLRSSPDGIAGVLEVKSQKPGPARPGPARPSMRSSSKIRPLTACIQTSRFETVSAFFSMNSRRGST